MEQNITNDNLNQEENRLIFSSKVQDAIGQVLQSSDPLDSPDFNTIDYINQLFPNEQSLANLDEQINKMEYQIILYDDNIRNVIYGQSNTGTDCRKALIEAQETIEQLYYKIHDIKISSEQTEQSVKEITSDIKQLDCVKKNLTKAITTLNHLDILIKGIKALEELIEKRLYAEILNPLQAVIEVNQHFQQYSDIEQIKDLSLKIENIQKNLSDKITEDFRNFFSPTPTQQSNQYQQQCQLIKIPLKQLSDSCKILSILNPKVRTNLLKWFLNLQLEEYLQLFHENQDIAWLDQIDKRYSWLKRMLLNFEDKFNKIFPDEWQISELITVEFCNITCSELTKIMKKRQKEIDCKLLLYAIEKTQNFEQLLAKRFTGQSIESNTNLNQAEKQSGFKDIIGKCFKAHLDIFVSSCDKNLSELIEKFRLDLENQNKTRKIDEKHMKKSPSKFSTMFFEQTSSKTKANVDTAIGSKDSSASDMFDSQKNIFSSCSDLFVFYKKSLIQLSNLSNETVMLDLTMIFKKYLIEYARKILQSQIPIGNGNNGGGHLQNLSNAAGQVLQNFLKEIDNQSRLTKNEIVRTCSVLTTAEYCLETIHQLELKLKTKIHSTLSEKISFSEEKDLYHRIISNCITLLVHDIELGLDVYLQQILKIQWYNINMVGDQSQYVTQILQYFKKEIPLIRDSLQCSGKYYTQFCLKFINSFVPKYQVILYKCKLINSSLEVGNDGSAVSGTGSTGGSGSFASMNVLGCEQLLLDIHSMKIILLDLPSIQSNVNRKAPASYTKYINNNMTRIEMIVKIVMQSINPYKEFFDNLFKLIPDIQLWELQKILEMKQLKRSDQIQLIDLYKKHEQFYRMQQKEMEKSKKFIENPVKDDKTDLTASKSNEIAESIGKIFKFKQQAVGAADGNLSGIGTGLDLGANSSSRNENDSGRIKKLENLFKKHLA